MQVPTAMVMRLDGTVGLVLTELRAMHIKCGGVRFNPSCNVQ
jgi:hypothetical protein